MNIDKSLFLMPKLKKIKDLDNKDIAYAAIRGLIKSTQEMSLHSSDNLELFFKIFYSYDDSPISRGCTEIAMKDFINDLQKKHIITLKNRHEIYEKALERLIYLHGQTYIEAVYCVLRAVETVQYEALISDEWDDKILPYAIWSIFDNHKWLKSKLFDICTKYGLCKGFIPMRDKDVNINGAYRIFFLVNDVGTEESINKYITKIMEAEK